MKRKILSVNDRQMLKTIKATGLMFALIFLVFLTNAAPSNAVPPVISNLQVQQLPGSYYVEFNFDVASDLPGYQLRYNAVVSVDGGDTWSVHCSCDSIDFFDGWNNISLYWNAPVDLPDFQSDNCRVRIFANDLHASPELDFFRVVGTDTMAMFPGVTDTVGFGQPMHLTWKGHSTIIEGLDLNVVEEMDTIYPYSDGLMGYKWRWLAEDCNPDFEDCWHPRMFNEATGDSFSYFAANNSLVFANDGSGNSPFNQLLPSGRKDLLIDSIDIAGNQVLEFWQRVSFVVNHDPETVLLNGETDWAHPQDEEIYPYYTLLNDLNSIHHPFTDGDRIPDRSYVVFKALFKDDSRDQILDPAYGMGITGHAEGLRHNYTEGLFSFQTSASAVNTDPTWGAGIDGFYADTLGFMPGPSTDFTFFMAGVDEHGRRDGTPARLNFQVGYPPCIQCLEILPGAYYPSAFPDDLDCHDPDVGGHPCFGDTPVFHVLQNNQPPQPGNIYLEQNGSQVYLAISKNSGFVEIMENLPDPDVYYSFESQVYQMSFLLHGKDDPREAWLDPVSRLGGIKYQVDYDCDPYNSIRDGGGIDNILQPTWGTMPGADGLEISQVDGVWKVVLDVVVPTQLINNGSDIFYLLIRYTMAAGDEELADEIFNKCIRQFSTGTIGAVALDQTQCGFYPTRPARYHLFHDVRPPHGGLELGESWRECDPSYPIDTSLNLYHGAMASLDNEPVSKGFQIIFQGSSGDLNCDSAIYRGRLAPPPWHEE